MGGKGEKSPAYNSIFHRIVNRALFVTLGGGGGGGGGGKGGPPSISSKILVGRTKISRWEEEKGGKRGEGKRRKGGKRKRPVFLDHTYCVLAPWS